MAESALVQSLERRQGHGNCFEKKSHDDTRNVSMDRLVQPLPGMPDNLKGAFWEEHVNYEGRRLYVADDDSTFFNPEDSLR